MSLEPASDVGTAPGSAKPAQVVSALRRALMRNQNSDGRWAYSAGKRTRLEPTCWALLALAAADGGPVDLERLRSWPQHDGWLVDVAGAPPNQPFNALAALTLLREPSAAPIVGPIVSNLLAAKGERYPNSDASPQDNSLQAWSWVEGTASWVEPTAWCLLLLKKLRQNGSLPPQGLERIQVGEQLLLDRVCSGGGWNYGNARVFDHDLWPYVPTTALALLALQDRRDLPVVTRSLQEMQHDLATERSAVALALALICLKVYGRSGEVHAPLSSGLRAHAGTAVEADLARVAAHQLAAPDQNVLGQAMALYALAQSPGPLGIFLF